MTAIPGIIHGSGLFTEIELQQYRDLWEFLRAGSRWQGVRNGLLPTLTVTEERTRRRQRGTKRSQLKTAQRLNSVVQGVLTPVELAQYRELWEWLNPGKQWLVHGFLPALTRRDWIRRKTRAGAAQQEEAMLAKWTPEQRDFYLRWKWENPGKRFNPLVHFRPEDARPLGITRTEQQRWFRIKRMKLTEEQHVHMLLWQLANPGKRFPGFRRGRPWPGITERDRAEQLRARDAAYRVKRKEHRERKKNELPMKAVINRIAQAKPGLKQDEFEAVYRKDHPQPETLNAENIRQAFAAYNKQARKRTTEGRPNTVGPDRTPR